MELDSFQAAIARSEQNVSDHAQYQDSYKAASDWLNVQRDRLSTCSEASGDKHTLISKLDRAQELFNSLADGGAKIDACVKNSEVTLPNTGANGQEAIKQEMESLKHNWSQHQSQLTDSKAQLETAINEWKVSYAFQVPEGKKNMSRNTSGPRDEQNTLS